MTRRVALQAAVGLTAGTGIGARPLKATTRAQVAITLDLEMSRHYPDWDDTHWDYEKGNLDRATKDYAVEAARRVRERGRRVHFFCVGRVLEQEDIGWLEEIVRNEHPVGNHTYDHVNVHAKTLDDVQFRFKRAPWLVEGKTPPEVIAENIRLCERAMRTRLDHAPDGFRTPGGSHDGLRGRPDVQAMLLEQGYRWVSSLYPMHTTGEVGRPPTEDVFDAIVAAQASAQPFAYPSGLVEVPMSPISDVNAFRTARWPRAAFLEAIRRSMGWTIENGATFDFLAHPSCLVVTDPEFEAIDLILDLVERAGDRADLVDLGAIAGNVAAAAG